MRVGFEARPSENHILWTNKHYLAQHSMLTGEGVFIEIAMDIHFKVFNIYQYLSSSISTVSTRHFDIALMSGLLNINLSASISCSFESASFIAWCLLLHPNKNKNIKKYLNIIIFPLKKSNPDYKIRIAYIY